jgi:mannosyltransferase
MNMDHAVSPLVAVDGIVFSLQQYGGISVYFRELLSRLRRDAVPTTLTLDGALAQETPPAGASVNLLPRAARPLERYRRWRLPATMRPGVFHSTYYRRPERAWLPSVVTVHDFTYERFVGGPRRWVHSAQKFSAIRAAQTVVCVSRSTLEDLTELVGLRADQQTKVIPNGVSDAFRPIQTESVSRPFMLFVGQRDGYKNFGRVLQSLALLPGLDLCCVGGGALRPDELSALAGAERRRVSHAGFVTEAELNKLYNQAQCLVYPSRYEGFGIPVAEAMRAGCPVVGTDCKAVCEVGGDALTIAEDEPAALAEAVLRTFDTDHRIAVIARGHRMAARYSWERTYRATLDVYRDLAGASLTTPHCTSHKP